MKKMNKKQVLRNGFNFCDNRTFQSFKNINSSKLAKMCKWEKRAEKPIELFK